MASVAAQTDIDISLTDQEATARRATRTGVALSVTLTPAQVADAFLQLTSLERAAMFNALARKSLTLEKGWDTAVDEVLADVNLQPSARDVISAPASHPLHDIRPGDTVRINVNCENFLTRASFAINATAVVARLDRTGRKVVFANDIALDYFHVTKL